MTELSPFRLMNMLFVGLGGSLVYGLLSAMATLAVDGSPEAQRFLVAYAASFKALMSLGLALGTAILVFRTQSVIPNAIEKAFTASQLAATPYGMYKDRFTSRRRSVEFVAEFVVVGFFIFTGAHFPLARTGEALMIVAATAEYGLGVYVGRKLCYAGMMLHSLLKARVSRNLFKSRDLDEINSYIHIASTLTVITVYLNVWGFYQGPFAYDTIMGSSVRALLILPAVIATPVLAIFNFYPRAVLRRIYSESIDVEIKNLQRVLRNEGLNDFEKRSYLIQVDKMSRDELRYSLQLSLSDLPIGITILIMLLQPLLGK